MIDYEIEDLYVTCTSTDSVGLRYLADATASSDESADIETAKAEALDKVMALIEAAEVLIAAAKEE